MGDLTKNFCTAEFACHCGCGDDHIKPFLVESLQEVRNHFGKPVLVLSGVRCETHNAMIGGTKHSQHLTGHAADIRINGVSSIDIARFASTLCAFSSGGIGVYRDFVHLDIRRERRPARWGLKWKEKS